jgi:hypothetical protein
MEKAYNSARPKLRLVDELKKPHKDLMSTQKTLEAIEHDHIWSYMTLLLRESILLRSNSTLRAGKHITTLLKGGIVNETRKLGEN